MLLFSTKYRTKLKFAGYEVHGRTRNRRRLRLRRLQGRKASLRTLPMPKEGEQLGRDEPPPLFQRRGMQAEALLGGEYWTRRHMGRRESYCAAEAPARGAPRWPAIQHRRDGHAQCRSTPEIGRATGKALASARFQCTPEIGRAAGKALAPARFQPVAAAADGNHD